MSSSHWLRRPVLLPGRPSEAGALYMRLAALGGFANAAGLVLYAYYAVRVAGLSPLELVLAGTALEASAFLFEIPTGVVADLVSRRLSVILGYLLIGAGFVLMGAAPEFWAVAGGQFVWGLGFTFISGAREAWLADEVGEEVAAPLYPAFARRRQIGSLAGGFAGVGIAWWWTAGGTLLVGGALYLAAGVYLLFTMTEHGFVPAPRVDRATWRTPLRQAAEGLRVARSMPVVVTALLTALLMGASSESFDRLWGFHLIQSFGLPDVMSETLFFGLVQLGGQLGAIAALRVAQSRTDFRRPGSVAVGLLTSNVVVVAAMCLFAGAPVFAVALVGAWVTFWARAVEEPFATAWVNRGLPSATRATVLSTMGQANALGQAAGGPLFGLLASLAGVRVAIAVAAAVLVPAVALYWRHRGAAGDAASEAAGAAT